MRSYDETFYSVLVKNLQVKRSELLEGLAKRKQYEQYMYECGQIKALDDLLNTCEEIRKELAKL